MAKKKIKKGAIVLTARDMLNGYIPGDSDYNLYSMTPLQMVPEKEKDEEWKKWNADWLERVAITQLSKTSRKIIKNYHLANGILDKGDYIIGEENDMNDVLNVIAPDNTLPIKFYSIIPNVISVLTGEFSKRDQRIIVKAVDDISQQEAYEYKKGLITNILVQRAVQQKQAQLAQMGMDLATQDPAQQQQIQSELDMAKQFAEAQTKFKSYRGIAEQWANHMIEVDNQRFDMYQLESKAFRDMLVADREFWHIKITDDDYEVEVWEPWNTFYHKSPSVEYISEGNYVGRMRLMSIADVIDCYGSKMTEEQILSLKNQHRLLNNFPLVVDSMADQENWYTDFNKPYPKNYTNVTWQKFLDGQVGDLLQGNKTSSGLDTNMAWYDINRQAQAQDDIDLVGPGMVRVTEGYFKSQRLVYELTWIKPDGTLVKDIVDENYKVTYKPTYDTMLNQVKSKHNLVEGEHLDGIWINEVRWCAKINSNLSSIHSRNYSDFEPIYLGGDPIPFQFKGQNNLYGCKLPVEGKIFSERGSVSSSLVDKMKPNQISFNIVNNQIIEYLADEIGNVLVIDQNTIPRNSMGKSWGPNNVPQFHQVMKDYQTAIIDPSIQNTGSATNFAHFQSIDLTKTNQIISRLKLAEYFKNEAFAVVGITPQRLGSVTASETATGTQQAVNNSYAQTEPYFDQHMNHLMPRVRQMMLDAAQFISATKPETRLSYLNKDEENEFFQMEGYKLLLRDFKVFAKSTADIKQLRDKLEQLAMQTIPAGGSLVDAARMISMQSPAEIISKLSEAEEKREMQIKAQQDHERQLQEAQQAFMDEQEAKQMENENYWKERLMQKDIYIAEIKAMGYAKDTDINTDNIPDALQVNQFLHEQNISAQDQLLKSEELAQKKQKLNDDASARQQEMSLRREEMKSKERIEKMKLRNPVSGENKKK